MPLAADILHPVALDASAGLVARKNGSLAALGRIAAFPTDKGATTIAFSAKVR
jgi:hypothetical protein